MSSSPTVEPTSSNATGGSRLSDSQLAGAADAATSLRDNVGKVIVGKPGQVQLAVLALLSGGHLLLEDVPGVGKTLLARSLARSIGGTFQRVQGAPDLLPTDVTGTSVFHQDKHDFVFVPGPLFSEVVLADELNRTPPRTQAALLEAMEEKQVTVDGTTRPLPDTHFVVATQNPAEQLGTFPLPESQLDRFTIATSLGYPNQTTEVDLVLAQTDHHPIDDLPSVLDVGQLRRLRRTVRKVHTSRDLVQYAVRLVRATREAPEVALGASPRATVQLVRASQARALLDGRPHVLPDDVVELAPAVLGHRLLLNQPAVLTARQQLVSDLTGQVAVLQAA